VSIWLARKSAIEKTPAECTEANSAGDDEVNLLFIRAERRAVGDALRSQHLDLRLLVRRGIDARFRSDDQRLRPIGSVEGALKLEALHTTLLHAFFSSAICSAPGAP
jgi:hypothetical protein